MQEMTYEQAVQYLDRIPKFSPRSIVNGTEPYNLTAITELLRRLGNPQDLMALAFKKKDKMEKNEPVEKLEAVCIQSHVKTLDGMIFAAEGLIEGEVIVNHRRYR